MTLPEGAECIEFVAVNFPADTRLSIIRGFMRHATINVDVNGREVYSMAFWAGVQGVLHTAAGGGCLTFFVGRLVNAGDKVETRIDNANGATLETQLQIRTRKPPEMASIQHIDM